MSKPANQQCSNCRMYEHVPAHLRKGREWLYTTGRCSFKPPSSKRPIKPKVHGRNWCDNWKENMNKKDNHFPQEGEILAPETDQLTLAWLHIRRRVEDVKKEEGQYATLVTCHIQALTMVLDALKDKVELPE